jgi:hypothetical protein
MIETAYPPLSVGASEVRSSERGEGATTGLTHAGVPAPPGSADGRARAFRQEQAKRRKAWRQRVAAFLVVTILVIGFYVILTDSIFTSRPHSSSPSSGLPSPGPPIAVHLGTPSVRTISCGAGGTAYAERIPWTNSTRPVMTGDFYVAVYEIADGDFIGDPGAVANATSSSLCAGVPPDSGALWYAVLAAPNGTNLLTYTVGGGWASVTHGLSQFWVENGSALTLVTDVSLAGTGREVAVYGGVDGSSIDGSIPL